MILIYSKILWNSFFANKPTFLEIFPSIRFQFRLTNPYLDGLNEVKNQLIFKLIYPKNYFLAHYI